MLTVRVIGEQAIAARPELQILEKGHVSTYWANEINDLHNKSQIMHVFVVWCFLWGRNLKSTKQTCATLYK